MFYSIAHVTDAGIAADGGPPFDYPPTRHMDSGRGAFERELVTSAYTGRPVYQHRPRPPDPEPYPVDLSRGVGLSEAILDQDRHLLALSHRLFQRHEAEVRSALNPLHPVSVFRSPGRVSGKATPKAMSSS